MKVFSVNHPQVRHYSSAKTDRFGRNEIQVNLIRTGLSNLRRSQNWTVATGKDNRLASDASSLEYWINNGSGPGINSIKDANSLLTALNSRANSASRRVI